MVKKHSLYWFTLLLILNVPAIAYEFVDLGTYRDYENSEAVAINNSGNIAGNASQDGETRGVRFTGSGGGNVGLRGEHAYDVNNNREILGVSNDQAVVFNFSGTAIQYIPNLNGYDYNTGYSMNDNGQVVGVAYTPYSDYQAFLFDPDDYSTTRLGTVDNLDFSIATSINNTGQVVGYSTDGLDVNRATLFDVTGAGNNIDLSSWDSYYSMAYCINDNGKIVGSEMGQAVLFDETGGGMSVNLGTLNDGDEYGYSVATSINNSGQIVGYSTGGSSSGCVATIFDPTGWNNIDLNTLVDLPDGWVLRQANDINDDGWIVGTATDDLGYTHAYLLIPEPATMTLLGPAVMLLRRKIR